MLITSERHLRTVLDEHAGHDNSHRPQRARHQGPPAGCPHPHAPGANVRVLRRDRLGGLIHEYAQVAYSDTVFGTHSLILPSERSQIPNFMTHSTTAKTRSAAVTPFSAPTRPAPTVPAWAVTARVSNRPRPKPRRQR